jgi:hypothetical protein
MDRPVIAGIISASGQIAAGVGFALERTGPGVYAIRFIEPCADTPPVLVTPGEPGRTVAAVATPAGAEVTLTDLTGTRTDGGFSFAALTPFSP